MSLIEIPSAKTIRYGVGMGLTVFLVFWAAALLDFSDVWLFTGELSLLLIADAFVFFLFYQILLTVRETLIFGPILHHPARYALITAFKCLERDLYDALPSPPEEIDPEDFHSERKQSFTAYNSFLARSVIFLTALAFLPGDYSVMRLIAVGLCAAALGMLIFGRFFLSFLVKALERLVLSFRISPWGWMRRLLDGSDRVAYMYQVKGKWGVQLLNAGLTLAAVLGEATAFYFLLYAFAIPLSYIQGIVVFTAVSAARRFPVAQVFGLGFFEMGGAACLVLMTDLYISEALAVVFIVHLIWTAFRGLIAGGYFANKRWRWF